MSDMLQIGKPANRKPCKHGSWVNVAPNPERDMPEMEFRCRATGYQGKATGKHEGLCLRCILYAEKEST